MLFNKLTLISIAAIISIASILVFIIPTDSIETQSLINNETQSVINSENPPINHTLSQSVHHHQKICPTLFPFQVQCCRVLLRILLSWL